MNSAEPRTLMRWIISSSLRFRYLVVAAAVATMVLGITLLPRMHVDVFPEFAPPRVVIQTACVGLSTSDVEQLVTVPLEASLNGIQGLDDLRSKSVPQLSVDRAALQAGHGSPPGPPARAGTTGPGQPEPADLGGAAGDAGPGNRRPGAPCRSA